jgi:hypothetical protein
MGRPRKYNNDNEGARIRMARLRAGRTDPPTAPERFHNLFLTSDSRLMAASAPAEPAWSVLDDLRDALGAIPIKREEIHNLNVRDDIIGEEADTLVEEPGM